MHGTSQPYQTGELTRYHNRNSHLSFQGIYGTKGTGTTNTMPGSRYNPNSWTDLDGNLWVFGGWGVGYSGGFSGNE